MGGTWIMMTVKLMMTWTNCCSISRRSNKIHW